METARLYGQFEDVELVRGSECGLNHICCALWSDGFSVELWISKQNT